MGIQVSVALDSRAPDNGLEYYFQRRQRGEPAGARLAQREAAVAVPDGVQSSRNLCHHLHARRAATRARSGRDDADGMGAATLRTVNLFIHLVIWSFGERHL